MGIGLGSLNPVRIVQGKGDIGEALGPAAPVIAGLALNTLAPGVGSAIGASLGLGAAAGTGALVGGITALASGNLQKGLMAGLGAYGGASIGAGLTSMGESALASSPSSAYYANSADMASDAAAGMKGSAAANAPLLDKMGAGAGYAVQNPKAALAALGSGDALKGAGILSAAAAPVLAGQMVQTATPAPTQSQGLIRPYQFNRKVITPTDMVQPTYQQGQSTRERNWFDDQLTAGTPYAAPGPEYKMAEGGDVQVDPNMQQVPSFDPVVRMASGGLGSLGGYASGGNPRLLKGPGDGMSDNIPAVIGGKQPARLADGEFVVPADVVSHLGNGSTEAGAKQLYKMMDRIRQQRTGKKRQAPEVNPQKVMPA
jgi:hypothetical protein